MDRIAFASVAALNASVRMFACSLLVLFDRAHPNFARSLLLPCTAEYSGPIDEDFHHARWKRLDWCVEVSVDWS